MSATSPPVTIVEPPAPPRIEPPAGVFANRAPVTIACGEAGTTIRYSLDGSDPTATNGTGYSGPFTLTASATVKARCFRAAIEGSVAEAAYSVEPVTFAAGDLIVLDGTAGVLKIDGSSGEQLRVGTEPECCGGQRFAIDGNGDLVVPAGRPSRLLRSPPIPASCDGVQGQLFRSANSVTIADDGTILVTDHEAAAVIRVYPDRQAGASSPQARPSSRRSASPSKRAARSSSPTRGPGGSVLRVHRTARRRCSPPAGCSTTRPVSQSMRTATSLWPTPPA